MHADTVGADIHPADLYREIRALRRLDESLRAWLPFLIYSGNVSKGPGKATERYMTLLNGTRIVPFDTSHILTITGTIITDDEQEGVACFDRNPLSASTEVDINYAPPQVEVITVFIGSGVTAQDKIDIATAVWSAAIRSLTTSGSASVSAQNITDIAAAVESILSDEIANLNANIDANDVTALVAAVKVKTDQLTFTKSNELDTNVKSMNDAELKGDGQAGNDWRAVGVQPQVV